MTGDRSRSPPDRAELKTSALTLAHPHRADLIAAYYARWDEMLGGLIEGTAEILDELDRRGTPLYALTNWSAETFGLARRRFPLLARFRGIVVSGEERLIKPDPRFFQLLLDRYAIPAPSAVFIDDIPRNVAAAAALGMTAVQFESPAALRRDLGALGLL